MTLTGKTVPSVAATQVATAIAVEAELRNCKMHIVYVLDTGGIGLNFSNKKIGNTTVHVHDDHTVSLPFESKKVKYLNRLHRDVVKEVFELIGEPNVKYTKT